MLNLLTHIILVIVIAIMIFIKSEQRNCVNFILFSGNPFTKFALLLPNSIRNFMKSCKQSLVYTWNMVIPRLELRTLWLVDRNLILLAILVLYITDIIIVITIIVIIVIITSIFFKLFLGSPMANFELLLTVQPHSPNVNHCIIHFQLEGHQEPHNEVGSLSLAEHLMGFESAILLFCHNPFTHLAETSPHVPI